ncbi:hypothetical protein [Pseudoroseomonas cervicalis]|uniref:hypothetical protein n=1 Tax=Teichococcus cervicalis TaxID=204525 RepID=UPI0022F165B2|nr:hypothetical protein [Pseudoroseomonas cervicalis]WBV43240.1 hypothetical protein PFY06_01320 [Pseudoroseomonas cervicalis]
MAINPNDGQFSVGYWIDPDSEKEEDAAEYGDDFQELRDRALKVISGGKYKYAVLYSYKNGEWEEGEHLTEEDL